MIIEFLKAKAEVDRRAAYIGEIMRAHRHPIMPLQNVPMLKTVFYQYNSDDATVALRVGACGDHTVINVPFDVFESSPESGMLLGWVISERRIFEDAQLTEDGQREVREEEIKVLRILKERYPDEV